MMSGDGSASDNLREQAAAMPQGEPVTGSSGHPESIRPQALLAQVLEQVGSRSVAAVQDAGADRRITIALLRDLGTTQPCATVGIQFIEPPDT